MKRMSTVKAKINRKVLTLIGVAVVLVGAVAANLLLNRNKSGEDATPASAEAVSETGGSAAVQMSFFESFRKERDTTRSQEIAYIDTIIEQGADAETMADAQQQKLSIVDGMEKEMTIESLLKAKGFTDAAVTLHAGSVNVVLSAEELSDEQVAQVLDIIVRETGEKADNIKITTAQ
jgi:stage III sporulation protein AH